MLFLMSAGLTLVFSVMGLINLAHGSLYMIGAFFCAAAAGNFWLGQFAGLAAAAAAGAVIEITVIRRLYDRDHLDQVLATFALILILSEGMRMIFGPFPLYLNLSDMLRGTVSLGITQYSLYRLALVGFGIAVAVGLWLLIARTRLGIQIRAGENDREMIAALGVNIRVLYTVVLRSGRRWPRCRSTCSWRWCLSCAPKDCSPPIAELRREQVINVLLAAALFAVPLWAYAPGFWHITRSAAARC